MAAIGERAFFTGIVLDFWRQVIPPEQTQAELVFIQEMLQPPPAGWLLDVPCGAGRHALPLAAMGYRMTGVDISVEFLRETRAKAAEAGVRVRWRRGDMSGLPWESEFDGAFCLGNSFGYRDHAGMSAFIAAVARALKPGGRFLMDSGMLAECILPNFEPRPWVRAGDILALMEHQHFPLEGRVETRFTFIRGGKEETRVFSHWVFTLAEVRRMFEAAGMRVTGVYSSTDGSPFEAGDPLAYVLAEKG